MLTSEPYVVQEGNLSRAWARAFCRIMTPVSHRLHTPLIISIDDFDEHGWPREDMAIREQVDQTIEAVGMSARNVFQVDATAQTIFPHMCWSPHRPVPADLLFERYIKRIYPRLKSRCRLNARGTYFLRMIRATGLDASDNSKTVNQLGDIIKWYRERNQKPINSMTQVSIRDPAKDHHGGARSGFPCLQQVGFSRNRDELVVSAFFPTENIFERGYGNYLGLARLGGFMANQMELRLVRLNVYIAQPRAPELPKSGALATLAARVRQMLDGRQTTVCGDDNGVG